MLDRVRHTRGAKIGSWPQSRGGRTTSRSSKVETGRGRERFGMNKFLRIAGVWESPTWSMGRRERGGGELNFNLESSIQSTDGGDIQFNH